MVGFRAPVKTSIEILIANADKLSTVVYLVQYSSIFPCLYLRAQLSLVNILIKESNVVMIYQFSFQNLHSIQKVTS